MMWRMTMKICWHLQIDLLNSSDDDNEDGPRKG
jgi:hypothetical protein